MTETPVTLLDRLRKQAGERDWERFVQLFTPLLVRWAQQLGVPPPDVEDQLQDIYAFLLRKLPEFVYDPQKSFRAWLWTVFHHQTLAWRKRRARTMQLLPQEIDGLASPDQVEEATEAEYRRMLCERALQLLQTDFAPETWQLFWQLVVEKRPGQEVAEQFGVTRNAVYLARARVLARLREELAGFDQ